MTNHIAQHRVLDRLNDFTDNQKAALLFVKRNDPQSAVLIMNQQIRMQLHQQMAIRKLKPGKIVKLVGLKKKDWNGKKAKIIGKKVLKSDMIKWPVQLMDGSKDKALIKQCNLQKLEKM